MKLNDTTMKPSKSHPLWESYNERQKRNNLRADIVRHKRQIWYLELILSACLGAALALGFVIAHQIYITG